MNDEKLKSQLGANIVAYRKSSGMTQAKLAQQINYSDKAVSKWERGKGCPDVSLLPELSRILEVDLEGLLSGQLAANTMWRRDMKRMNFLPLPGLREPDHGAGGRFRILLREAAAGRPAAEGQRGGTALGGAD